MALRDRLGSVRDSALQTGRATREGLRARREDKARKKGRSTGRATSGTSNSGTSQRRPGGPQSQRGAQGQTPTRQTPAKSGSLRSAVGKGLGRAYGAYEVAQGLRAFDQAAGGDVGAAAGNNLGGGQPEQLDRGNVREGNIRVRNMMGPSSLPSMYSQDRSDRLSKRVDRQAQQFRDETGRQKGVTVSPWSFAGAASGLLGLRAGSEGGIPGSVDVPERFRDDPEGAAQWYHDNYIAGDSSAQADQGQDDSGGPFGELPQIGADFMDSIGPAGRERVSPDREETVDAESGPVGIRSARGDTQKAINIQQDAGNFAPSLPGDPSEQEVITMEDGQGGTASIRAPAGMRRGGGTVSTVSNAAAAAVPVDSAGLRRARQAAADRGDWEAVERSYMNPAERRAAERESRREQLRDIVSSSQGMDQSVGGMVQEGIRRRAAQQELATMEAEDAQMREQRASLRRARASNRPSPLEIARFRLENQREETEAQRAQREENREVVDRAAERTDPESGNTYVDTTLRNRIESLSQRLSGGDTPDPQAVQQIGDLARVTEELNAEAAESWETPILGDLVDWFRTGPSTAPQAEVGDMVESLRNLKEAGVRRENRSRRGAPWPFETNVITWRGQDLNIGEIPAEEREVLYSLIDRIPDSISQGGN